MRSAEYQRHGHHEVSAEARQPLQRSGSSRCVRRMSESGANSVGNVGAVDSVGGVGGVDGNTLCSLMG